MAAVADILNMIFNTHSSGQNMYQKIPATEVAG